MKKKTYKVTGEVITYNEAIKEFVNHPVNFTVEAYDKKHADSVARIKIDSSLFNITDIDIKVECEGDND